MKLLLLFFINFIDYENVVICLPGQAVLGQVSGDASISPMLPTSLYDGQSDFLNHSLKGQASHDKLLCFLLFTTYIYFVRVTESLVSSFLLMGFCLI